MRSLGLAALVACSGAPHPAPSLAPTPQRGEPVAAPAGAQPDARPDAAVLDATLVAKATAIVDAYTNTQPQFTRDGKRVVFLSNRDGVLQLYVAGAPDLPATRVTTTTERIGAFAVAPGNKDVVFSSDTGADENFAFFRIGLDGKNLVQLTEGTLHRDAPMIPDGRPSILLFTGRDKASSKSTLYTASAIAAGPAKPIYTDDKPAFLLDTSADGKTALLLELVTSSEKYLVRVDVESGKAQRLFPAQGQMSIHNARLSRDGTRAIVATDLGGEQMYLLALDAMTGKQLAKHAITPATAEVEGLELAKQGNTLAVLETAGTHSELHLFDARSLAPRGDIKLPLGAGNSVQFSDDGKRLAIDWSTPRTPTDLFSIDVASGKVVKLRDEPVRIGAIPEIQTKVVDIPAFDGGKIPTNLYLPADLAKKSPVLVVYHGGPAGSSIVRWSAITAFFLAQGYAVVEPNVRGSGGFGRAFEEADNGPKRLDAFKDVETSARWVAAQPWADKDRLVVFGSSYGGYTTLIALSRWPDIWRAGVDLVGIVNLETFMASTSGVIHDLFLLEFGEPTKDADFLRSISPITDVAKIVDPLFVYAGANDPRVPRPESDQIVKAVRGRKVPVEYMLAANEGHSLSHRENVIALLARCAKFLADH